MVHLSTEYYFSILLSSLIILARFEMNLLRKLILPRKACNYLIFLGGLMFRIASILAGSILIPALDIICPSNLPSSNANKVLLGFREMPNFLHLRKTCLR